MASVGAGIAFGESDPPKEAPLSGPALAAASNFGHHRQDALALQAFELGVLDYRDTINWSLVETEPGRYDFGTPTTQYPASIAAAGGQMSLTVNWGNGLYDSGETPYTPGGRAAFARFVVAALDAYPAITAVEVGNEVNGPNFVTGPVKEAVRSDRAAVYFPLLKAVYEAVKPVHPEVSVLGGGAHSIPGGYLWPLLDLGGADYMDALVLHPYSTPPEQLMRQIAVLRRHDAAVNLPIQVTEFGDKDAAAAPGYLLRMYCAMALSGVERAAWYPLNDRGDDLHPLIDPQSGRATPAGRTFALVQERLVGQPVTDVSPDPFTYACLFADHVLVIWGAPRDLSIGPGVGVESATGQRLGALGLKLSMSEPLIVTTDEPFDPGESIRLGPNLVVADSFHQFRYPEDGEKRAGGDPFQRFARRADRRIRLYTMQGQDAPGSPWTPYLGNRHIRPVRLMADHLVVGGDGRDPIEIVHRYIADRTRGVDIDASWTPAARSTDGIDVAIQLNGEVLYRQASVRSMQDVTLSHVKLKRGDRLDFIVGPGPEGKGDVADYRIVLRESPD